MELPGFFSNVSLGWRLGLTSLYFVKDHKKTVLFSLFSSLLFSLTIFVFFFVFLFSFFTLSVQNSHGANYYVSFSSNHFFSLSFLFLVITLIFSTIMKVSLSFYTNQIFHDRHTSISKSLGHGFSRFFAIAQWALIDVTVGTILKVLQRRNTTNGIANFLLHALSLSAQFSWTMLTLFVIPLLALKDFSILDTIQESASLLETTWQQTLSGFFRINFILFLILSTWYLFLFCYLYFTFSSGNFHSFSFVTHHFFAFMIPLFLYRIIHTTSSVILKTALYNFSQNQPTGPFASEFLKIKISSLPQN